MKFSPYIALLFSIFTFISCSTDSNDPIPSEVTITTSDFAVTMDENPENGQVIGTVTGSTNEGSVTFSITEQTPSGAFSIDAASGELSVANENLFSFETNPIIAGIVKVANGAIFENASVTITLNDLNVEEVYEGDVILRSQQEVNDFGVNRYTKITGSLVIGDPEEGATTDIVDLSPLQSLRRINESFQIINNPILISTAGLNIDHIGIQLEISYNSSLEKVEGLNNLTSLSDLHLYHNYALSDLSGFSQLTRIDHTLSIFYCSLMANLDWLSNLTTIGSELRISSCHALTNVDGLNNLRNFSGQNPEIKFLTNARLENLNGLQNLNTTLLNLNLSDNSSLLNIEGLENIDVTNYIIIFNNRDLENLRGLETVTTLLGFLSIKQNNSLSDLQGLNNLYRSGDIQIWENNSLLRLEGLSNLSDISKIDIRSNTQLSDFCALQDLFSIAPQSNYLAAYNAYNPTKQDIIDGNCSI